MKDIQAATDRLFRDYFRHCQAPNEDTLFHSINSLHSFNGKLKRYRKGGLHDSPRFIGLKARMYMKPGEYVAGRADDVLRAKGSHRHAFGDEARKHQLKQQHIGDAEPIPTTLAA